MGQGGDLGLSTWTSIPSAWSTGRSFNHLDFAQALSPVLPTKLTGTNWSRIGKQLFPAGWLRLPQGLVSHSLIHGMGCINAPENIYRTF